jgi:hypothetical protein
VNNAGNKTSTKKTSKLQSVMKSNAQNPVNKEVKFGKYFKRGRLGMQSNLTNKTSSQRQTLEPALPAMANRPDEFGSVSGQNRNEGPSFATNLHPPQINRNDLVEADSSKNEFGSTVNVDMSSSLAGRDDQNVDYLERSSARSQTHMQCDEGPVEPADIK